VKKLTTTLAIFAVLNGAPASAGAFFQAEAEAPSTLQSPPPPAPPREAKIPQPVEKTLANGLRVIVIPKRDMPLVATRLMIKTGAEADPPGLEGLAETTASVLTRGTKTRSAEQIARGIEALGATLVSEATWDASWANSSVMSSKLREALVYISDVARNATFSDEEIERQRQQALDSVRVALRQPAALAAFVANRVIFGNQPYGHILGGTPESLERLERVDVIAFHKRYYVPANAILIFAGDLDPARGFALAQEYFGTWKNPTSDVAPASAGDAEKPDPPAPRVVVIDMPEAGQSAVVVARQGIRRVDPAYLNAIVTNSVLGGGYSARLNQEIRIKRGLSYGARSAFELRRDTGPFAARTETKNESAAEVAAIILEEMGRLGTTDVAELELTPRKAVLIGSFARSLETTEGIVGRIATLALYGLPLDEINRYIRGVESVKSADVQRFASSNLGASGSSVVIVGDAKQFLEPLKKRFPNVEVIPIAELDLNSPALRKKAA
jgi:zinc protease